MTPHLINAQTGKRTALFVPSVGACHVFVSVPLGGGIPFVQRLRHHQFSAAIIRLLRQHGHVVECGLVVPDEGRYYGLERLDDLVDKTPWENTTLRDLVGLPLAQPNNIDLPKTERNGPIQVIANSSMQATHTPTNDFLAEIHEGGLWDVCIAQGIDGLAPTGTSIEATAQPTEARTQTIRLNIGLTNLIDEDGVALSNDVVFKMVAAYTPTVLRYVLLRFAAFAKPLEFSSAHLEHAAGRVAYAYRSIQAARRFVHQFESLESQIVKDEQRLLRIENQARGALSENFDSPTILAAVDEICRRVNEYASTKSTGARPVAVATTRRLLRLFDEIDGVLGLFSDEPTEYLAQHRKLALRRRSLDVKEIEKLISRRVAARTGRDWSIADDIKRQLEAKGVMLKDREGATDWFLIESADIELC